MNVALKAQVMIVNMQQTLQETAHGIYVCVCVCVCVCKSSM